MKRTIMISIGVAIVGMAALAAANPAMLPKHPGYPSGGEFANDTGQHNLTHDQSLANAAVAGGLNLEQEFDKPNSDRLLQHEGAKEMPVGGRSQGKTEPPSTKGTRTPSK
jgi:hypothetical protein